MKNVMLMVLGAIITIIALNLSGGSIPVESGFRSFHYELVYNHELECTEVRVDPGYTVRVAHAQPGFPTVVRVSEVVPSYYRHLEHVEVVGEFKECPQAL